MSLSIDLHRNRGLVSVTIGRWLELRGWEPVVLAGRPPLWRHAKVFGAGLYDTTEALIRTAMREAEDADG